MSKSDNSFELNWNNFKAKYNAREHEAFERLSYILFCLEHNQQFGIFRYLNQAGIETDPICVNNKQIGFQAKFYDTKISENKADIIDSITKAINKHPNLNKIFLYTNKELSESSKSNKSKPQYQEKIERIAQNNNIELVWRVPSHFEKQLSIPTNKWLYEDFFSLNKGLIDFIKEIKSHTQNNLEFIKTEILYNGSSIKIDRTDFIEQFKNLMQTNHSIIISGEGGCGKTAVIKELFSNSCRPFFLFKTNEFNNKTNINELFFPFGNYTFNDFIETYQNESEKIIVIDSAEKLADIENLDSFQIFIQTLLKNHWKIIFTVRNNYLDNIIIQLINITGITPNVISLDLLSIDELTVMAHKNNFELPQDEKLCELLKVPFYLSEYINTVNASKLQFKDFKCSLWNNQIMNSQYKKAQIHIRREKAFIELIKQKNLTGNFIVIPSGQDNEALDFLCQNEIIKYDESQYGYFIVHDIYEEWGLEKFIDITYHENLNNPEKFFENLGSSLGIRRAFRSWLSDKLYENEKNIFSVINFCINSNVIENFWRDEIVVSVMLSPYADKFFKQNKIQLLENNQEFLVKVIFLLRVACKEIDYDFLKSLRINKSDWLNLKYIFTVPKGKGWEYCIQFIYDNREIIKGSHLKQIIPFLQDWMKNNKLGIGTKYAGQLALFYLNHTDLYRRMNQDIIKILLQSVRENKKEINEILIDLFSNNQKKDHTDFIRIILKTPLEVLDVINEFPELVIKLAERNWLRKYEEPNEHFITRNRKEIEECFGFQKQYNFYYPASAFQTPTYFLLKNHFEKAIKFIISIVNGAVEEYVCSEQIKYDDKFKKIKIYVDEKRVVEQYSSERLWLIYRGASVSSHILESILMALERILLEKAEKEDSTIIEPILLKLLIESNSVAITAVIASIVTSQPEKLYNIAKILFKTWDTFNLDLHRTVQEPWIFLPTGFGEKIIPHRDERIKSKNLPHRVLSLENIALSYQLNKMENCSVNIETRRNELCEIWDNMSKSLPENIELDESILNIKCTLERIDYRKLEVEDIERDEQSQQVKFLLKTKANPQLDKQRAKFMKQHTEKIKYLELSTWARTSYDKQKKEKNKYDDNPHLAFSEMQEILTVNDPDEEFSLLDRAVPAYISAVLLKEYGEILSIEELEICKNVLMKKAVKALYMDYFEQCDSGIQPAIETLDIIIKTFPQEKAIIQVLLVLLLYCKNSAKKYSINCLLTLWNIDFNYAHNIWLAYLQFQQEYEVFFQKLIKARYEVKFNEIEKGYEELGNNIEKFFKTQHSYKTSLIEQLKLTELNTAFQMLPNGSCNEEHFSFCLDIIPKFVDVFDEKHDYEIQYVEEKNNFLKKFSYYLLNLPKEKIKIFLAPLLLKEHLNEDFSKLLLELAVAQDVVNHYDIFWYIWLSCYDKITLLVNESKNILDDLIENYLFAGEIMNCNNARSWHSLQKEDMKFYYNVAKDMGEHPHILYSIARVFNGIASNFIEDGMKIIHQLIISNQYEQIDNNTVYYLEKLSQRYYLLNKVKLKTNLQQKKMLIDVLTFLFQQGSEIGYLLREQVV